MPKPKLKEPLSTLEGEVIETMLAGLHLYRPDLNYPESHSDMSSCARALFKMFKVERRPLSIELPEDD